MLPESLINICGQPLSMRPTYPQLILNGELVSELAIVKALIDIEKF